MISLALSASLREVCIVSAVRRFSDVVKVVNQSKGAIACRVILAFLYSTITKSLLLRPNTSGEYISSTLVGGTTKVPGVVARAT